MSKRNNKPNLAKKASDVRRPGTDRKPLTNKSRIASGKPGKGAARAYEKPAAKAAPQSVLTVRIVAAVIAVLALAGGVYWSVVAGSAVNTGMIVGMVALGVLAGLAIFAAVRPEMIAARVAGLSKR